MRLLVQGPNRHTKLAEELQGAVAPRDDAIVRLPYTGQDFWRILYKGPKVKKKKYVKMYKVLQNFLKGLDEDVIDDRYH